ncbi:hypothetical protein ACFL96_19080 [Thermoproteota archaeon]
MNENWKRQDRNLVKGDIIRCKVGNKSHEKYGEYCYAICSGDGFGCKVSTMGNAIFVDHSSFELSEVLGNKDKDTSAETGDRWERFWGIEYLEAEK